MNPDREIRTRDRVGVVTAVLLMLALAAMSGDAAASYAGAVATVFFCCLTLFMGVIVGIVMGCHWARWEQARSERT
jgi:hypothetical protein